MSTIAAWPAQAESWLDARGKPAWIGAAAVSLFIFWPAGLALLAYMIWSKRMFNVPCAHRRHWHSHGFRPTGNSAFDAYKADTLRRLEDEQKAFETFLQRLREAKDKTEFDQFMAERAKGDPTPAKA